MTGKDIFKIWAPTNAKWTDWIRPVPFVSINSTNNQNLALNFTIPKINYLNEFQSNIAIILDLPLYDSVKEGLALTKIGYRPIPLYNGTNAGPGVMPLIDNNPIEKALEWGAFELKKIEILKDAPPAFLLDSNRTHRFKMDVSVFDNSWDLYAQDIPSAEYFLNNEINTIIVRGEKIQKDINRILFGFQKKGIKIFFTNGYEAPKEVRIKKPPRKQK